MKKPLEIVAWVLWAVVLVIIGVPAMELENGTLFLGGYLFLSLLYFLVHFRMKKVRKGKAEQKAKREEGIAAGVIPAHTHITRHEAGLPVPVGVPCEVRVFAGRLEFFAGGQLYQVPMDRVIGAHEYNDTEMRQYIRSSTFQTILGAAAFGGMGAVIGAMPESKYKREVSKHNMAVSFVSEAGESSAVVLSADTSLLLLGTVIRKYCRGVGSQPVTL